MPDVSSNNTVFNNRISRSTPLVNKRPRATAPFRRDFIVQVVCLMVLAIIAYHNSFGGSWVFDDGPAIVENTSLRAPWSLGEVLLPSIAGGATVSGRPVLNLSFALNYIVGGSDVWGYHAINLLIHLMGGLLLFGVVRRTCLQPLAAGKYSAEAGPLGLAVAAIWLVHPLQTESVSYIVQRAESLMGLWYLLTLYGFIRGATTGGKGGRWYIISGVACLLGMATKEVMVSVPLVVLLYDRTFVAGSFREAWRCRRGFYLSLAATWLLLAWLLATGSGRGGTAGFGSGVSAWNYALTQCQAVVHYLRLVIWPVPLVFDYGTATVGNLGEVWPQALLLLGLVGATGWALWRRPAWGFLGSSFFLILAPSSSVVPVATQTIAEHRMYLPLAIPLILIVLGLNRLTGRLSFVICALLALGGSWLTVQRNEDYRTARRLWEDTVAKYPANGRAQHELGKALFEQGQAEEALGYYRTAIRLQPGVPEPLYNCGLALAALGRPAEAMEQYRAALRLQPEYADAHNNLGTVLLAQGRPAEAEAEFRAALRARPDYAKGYSNLSNVLLELGRTAEAVGPARAAVRLDPAYVTARYNLGNALAETGQWAEAAAEYEGALRLQEDFPEVHNNLGNVLLQLDRVGEAIGHYETAVRLKPDYVDPRRNLAHVLVQLNRPAEAIKCYEALVRLLPGDTEIRAELERLRVQAR
jgi:tetratricopeptide (TPR) repeat protein